MTRAWPYHDEVATHNQEDLMATTTNTTPDTTPTLPPVEADAPAVEHDRAITNVGSGRITFKGHNAKAGYPFRIWEGQVQALVGDSWVEAPDAQAVEA